MPLNLKGCDWLLNGVPLMFYRDGRQAAMRADSDPGTEPTEPASYGNFVNGLGSPDYQIPGMYIDGDDIEVTPDAITPSGERVEIDLLSAGLTPTGPFKGGFRYSTDLWFIYGQLSIKIAGGTTTAPVLAADLGAGFIAQSVVEFNGAFYISGVDAARVPLGIWKTPTGVTYTQSTGANAAKMGMLQVVFWDAGGTPSYRLIGNPSIYQFRTVSGDPMSILNWTAAVQVGSPFYPMFSMPATSRHVLFGKTDGVFDVDPRNHTPNITPEWRQTYDPANAAAAVVIGNRLYINRGSGLDVIPLTGERLDEPIPVQPGAWTDYSGRIHGRCTALASYRGQIIAAFFNPYRYESYVCFGTPANRAGAELGGPIRWMGSYSTVPGQVTMLHVDSPLTVENAYLWIGTENFNTPFVWHLYRQYLAEGGSLYQELKSGGTPRFQTTGTVRFGDGWPEHRNLKRAPWRIRLESALLSGVATIDVGLSADGGAVEPQASVNISPFENFAATLEDGPALRLQPEITLHGTALEPAVFKGLGIDADLNREQATIRTGLVTLGRDASLGQGSIDPRDQDELREQILALQAEDAEPVPLIDHNEREYLVQVLPGINERLQEDREGRWVNVMEISTRELQDTWLLDTGVQLDTGRRLR